MAQWVDATEAAGILGMSIYTVKRKAKKGEIPARQEKTPTGFKWFIEIDTPEEQQSQDPPSEAAGDGYVATLVEVLKGENAQLWLEVEARRREVSELHVLLQQAHQRLALPLQHSYSDGVADATAAVEQAPKRSWWKKLFAS